MACTRLTDFFTHVMRQQGYTIFNYVDYVTGIGPISTVKKAYQFLLNLLQQLGFPSSNTKLDPPSRRCNCLGVIIDTNETTISVPKGKIEEILDKCNEALSKANITKRQLRSISGSLKSL